MNAMVPTNVQPVKNLSIDNLIYVPIGEYKQMFTRPYVAAAQQQSLDTLIDRMSAANNPRVNAGMLNGLTKRLVYPSSVGVPCAVDQNWVSESKYLWLLSATIEDNFNMIHRYYLQGYTNYNGITMNGTGDHRMEHTVNTVIETQVVSNQSPYGLVQKERLSRVYNVMHGSNVQTDLYMQRPSDVYGNMHAISLSIPYGQSGAVGSVNNYHTGTTVSAADSVNKTSGISNNIPTDYLANVINAGLATHNQFDFNYDQLNDVSLASAAKSNLSDPDIKNNQFLKILAMRNQTRRYGVFSLGELCAIDPSIEARFMLYNITKDFVDPLLQNTPNVGEYWDGQNTMTVAAYSIIEASVSLAARFGFSKMFFTASNQLDATFTPYVVAMKWNSVINLDEMETNSLVELFKTAFLQNVFMDESRGNALPLTIHMYVDLFSTSKVAIVDDYGRDVWYTIPTFANSNFSPVVTRDKGILDNLSQQVQSMTDHLASNLSRR